MNTITSLKRSANIRSRKNIFSAKKSEPLHIIVEEEEEPRPSCSSSSSNGKRRQLAVSPSDIRIAKTPLENAFDCDAVLSAPRPAPRPPSLKSSSGSSSSAESTPNASPDSFRLTFTDTSYKFPHPPIPTPSSSSCSSYSPLGSPCLSPESPVSSPSSQGLPLTPSSSDDEFRLAPAPRPSGLKRLRSIKPLVIVKHAHSASQSANGPSKSETEVDSDIEFFRSPKMFANSPLPSSTASSQSDSEEEVSDSEWYSRDISRLLTLRSVLPPAFPKRVSASNSGATLGVPTQNARPESMCASILDTLSPCPSPTKPRAPVSPSASPSPISSARSSLSRTGGFPSAQLDPAFPRSSTSSRTYRYPIPTRPPPPVPSSPSTPVTPATPDSAASTTTSSTRRRSRPPPRMSIPRDFFDSVIVPESQEEAEETDGEDNVLYYYIQDFSETEEGERSGSSPSIYSQDSQARSAFVLTPVRASASAGDETDCEVDEDEDDEGVLGAYEFDLGEIAEEDETEEAEVGVQSPPPNLRLSLPTSLLSLDFERFREEEAQAFQEEDEDSDDYVTTEESYHAAPALQSPLMFTNPFPTHPSTSTNQQTNRLPSASSYASDASTRSIVDPNTFILPPETRILRSKWSSSTLGSVAAGGRSRNGSTDSSFSTGTARRGSTGAAAVTAGKGTVRRGSERSSTSSKLKLWLKAQTLTSSSSSAPKTKKAKGKAKQRTVVVVGPSSNSPLNFGNAMPMSPQGRGFGAIYGPELVDLSVLKSPKRNTFGVPTSFSPVPATPSSSSTPMMPKTPSSAHSTVSSFSFSTSTSSPRSPTSPSPSAYTHRVRRSRSSRSTSTMSSSSHSSSACSCASSGDSVLSTGSDGLRRKPIPVEMFLRA
ncbi:hypothetical protein VKT23_015852 [Stygiomarasmius scandens]|uniref:Uncharacterized protein n=1 Tax=Marasmiellus scandens TaxID=2682957 RepID=A0ABR1J175_9AGAR